MSSETKSIIVQNIPENLCNITALYSHFKKYGHIQSIRISSKHKSIIRYETVEQARESVYSTEAFGNNRFVNIIFNQNELKSKENLQQFVNYSKLRKNARMCMKNIKEEQLQTLNRRFSSYKSQTEEIYSLQNNLESLINEAKKYMSIINELSGFEREKTRNRIIELSEQIKDLEDKLDKATIKSAPNEDDK